MKSVRHVVIDKNGGEQVSFNPTGHMVLFAIEKAKAPGEGDPELARRAGISPSQPAAWAKKYGTMYLAWLEEFIEASHFSRQAEVLEAVGMIHATQGQYAYWKDLAKKHGVIADEVKEVRVTLNTDFNIVLAQGDLADARRRILQEVRGLGEPGKPRVVDVTPPKDTTSPEGAGSGAGDMQGRSVALPPPLVRDGGQPERGTPVPAVSKRDTPPGTNKVLAKRAVPSRTKK